MINPTCSLLSHCEFYGYACKVFETSFPKAPSDLADLFYWHDYNTNVLLANTDVRSRFIKLLSETDKIVLHEDYAGVGTCGVTLVQQFQSMKAHVASDLPQGTLSDM